MLKTCWNRRLRGGLLIFCMSVALTGCAGSDWNVFRDRSEDYKQSQVYPMIEVPQGIHAEPFNDNYEIP